MEKKDSIFSQITKFHKLNELSLETRYNIYILFCLATGGILILSIFNLAGSFGSLLSAYLMLIFGRGIIFLVIGIFLLTLKLVKIQKSGYRNWEMQTSVGWGFALLFFSILGSLSLFFGIRNASDVREGGGFLGYFLYPVILSGKVIDLGPVGSFFILFLMFGFSIMLISKSNSYVVIEYIKLIIRHPGKLWDLVPDFFQLYNKYINPDKNKSEILSIDQKDKVLMLESDERGDYSKLSEETITLNKKLQDIIDGDKIDRSNNAVLSETNGQKENVSENSVISKGIGDNWAIPNLSYLLKGEVGSKTTKNTVEDNKLKIQNTFASFGIEVVMGDAITGPTVSQYTFRPASGIKLSRIASLQNDLALALAAPSIRMELPIPGQSAASIEIPNKAKSMVRIRDLIDSDEFKSFDSPLAIAVGKKVSGSNFIFSLAKAPHLLVAGATGAGKSVWINSMLLSLLYRYSPKNLQLILVDMKMVELNLYDDIPHLLTNVITQADNAINALKWSVVEMDRRYKLLKQYGKRNIKDYNNLATKATSGTIEILPFTVFVIDELADLMIQAKNEVEPIIARLTAMSRAVGIHLVLGTQRPDVNVVTGLIKTNVPTRVCFAVASQIDSRVVLDASGGESLLGQGDGLIKSPSSIQPIRFQGANVEEEEIKQIVNYLIKQKEKHPEFSNYNGDVTEPPSGSINVPGLKNPKGGGISSDDLILLYEEARKLVIELQSCSTPIVAGNLQIEPKLAEKIIDKLEEEGVIGPEVSGNTLREVYLKY